MHITSKSYIVVWLSISIFLQFTCCSAKVPAGDGFQVAVQSIKMESTESSWLERRKDWSSYNTRALLKDKKKNKDKPEEAADPPPPICNENETCDQPAEDITRVEANFLQHCSASDIDNCCDKMREAGVENLSGCCLKRVCEDLSPFGASMYFQQCNRACPS